MTGAVISTALQALLLIPAARLATRAKCSPCDIASEHSEWCGKVTALAFMLYFIYESFLDIGDLAYFTDYFFSVNMPRLMTALCVALAAVCAARTDIAVIGRTARIAFAGVVLMLIIIALGAAEDMDITRFDLAVEDLPAAVGKAVHAESSRCECLVLFCFLADDVDGDPEKTARRFILAKGVVITLILGMTTAVLGSYGELGKLPVFSLAAASENLITERSDAVFLVIWVITGLVKLTNLIHCAARCFRFIRPETTELGSALACGLLPAFAALPLLLGYGWEKIIYSEHPLTPIIVLALVLPSFLLWYKPTTAASAAESEG